MSKARYLRIDEIVESVSVTHKFDKPTLKFLNTSDIERGKIVNVNLLPINELKGQAKKTIKQDDILFSEIRPKNGRYAYIDFAETQDFVVSTKLMVLRKVNPDVDNKYFYYFLTNDRMLQILQDRAENRICSFPQITFDLLSGYKVRIPDLYQQRAIARVLSQLDEKIEINRKINAELESLARAIYIYNFVQNVNPKWKRMTLNDLGVKVIRGVTYNKQDIKKPSDNDVVGILRATNISGNVIDLEDLVYIDKWLISDIQKLKPLDILITMSSGSKEHIGKNGLFPFETDVAFGAFCSKIKTNEQFRLYVYMYLQSEQFKQLVNNSSLGTNIYNLNNGIILDAKILLPDDETIKKFNAIVMPIIEKMIMTQNENRELANLRDFLLPLLMNGQVTVEKKA